MFQIRRAAIRSASSANSCMLNTRSIAKPSPFVFSAQSLKPVSSFIVKRFNSDNSYDRRQSQQDDSMSRFSPDVDNYGGQNSRDSSFSRDRPFSAPVDLTPNPSIYVGNLVFHVTEEDLKREFSSIGPVKSVTIATDARGLSKGFGYVEFEETEQAEAAIAAKNQTVFEGRRLIVNYQAKKSRIGQENPPSKTLFVGNLAFELTDTELNKLFRDVRNVVDVRVAVDRRTGMPRGFAHADFISVEDAVKAKEKLADCELLGRKLRVDFSAGVRGSPSSESRE
ncbi:Nuclear localization sequence-binding protein [Golovinomyces cichoracearum]|uniref:Nuclear localization sequence-binding protein n=1 Tax=Golovinomyces cichoracearum TaxID=62708 RepID=A0A420IG33_9PEZI|nr:Nuclear localization sequence-binding protein [Golovinomyces cichoracearum]